MATDVAPDLGGAPALKPSSTLTVGLEERPPLPQAVALGFQHVLVSNVWLDPVFVAAVGGLSAALAGNLINAIFLAAGLVTLTQSTRLVRLPIVEGPSAAFDGLMIGFAKAGQLAMATTGLLIGGVLVLIIAASGLLGLVRRLFSPAVTGSVILLVGIALAGFTLEEFFGGNPTSPDFRQPANAHHFDRHVVDGAPAQLFWQRTVALVCVHLGFTGG